MGLASHYPDRIFDPLVEHEESDQDQRQGCGDHQELQDPEIWSRRRNRALSVPDDQRGWSNHQADRSHHQQDRDRDLEVEYSASVLVNFEALVLCP